MNLQFTSQAERIAFECANWVDVYEANPVESVKVMRQLRNIQMLRQRHNNYYVPIDLRTLLKAALMNQKISEVMSEDATHRHLDASDSLEVLN